MPKNKPTIHINQDSGIPLVEQLRRQLLWKIAAGIFQPGDLLPPVRKLARELNINLHTIRSAYKRLEVDGLVQTQQGSGTRVLEIDPSKLIELAGRVRSHTIGVILPGIANPFYHAFLTGVEENIQQRDFLIFICDAHDNAQTYFRHLSQLAARNVDGIIIASLDLQTFSKSKLSSFLPLVTVDCPECKGPTINFDLEEAALQAVSHLLKHGHKRIGMITVDLEAANIQTINAGYQKALREADIQPERELITRVPDFLIPSGEIGAQQLMGLEEPPTAIFTIADTLAFGAMQTLKRGGWKIPEHVAITSLNDIPSASLVDPPLTTVSLPAQKLGFEAAKILLDMIDGHLTETTHTMLPTELVIRKSCGCNS